MTNQTTGSYGGTKRWHDADGNPHREDGPAVIHATGEQLWCLHGKLHREDGPAILRPSRSEEWYLNNQRHRTDGPAIIFYNRVEQWYISGKRHREDGPATIYADGSIAWFAYDILYTFDEYCEKLNLSNEGMMLLKIQYG